MKTPWKVTFDPMMLMEPGATFAALETEAHEQGEDIIQAECLIPKKKQRVLDLGWYRDRYRIYLVEDSDWESPIQSIECGDLKSAMAAFRKLFV